MKDCAPHLACAVGNAERSKGRRAEQEVARIFRAHGFEVARTPNSGGLHVKGDVTGVPGFHIEVKRQETLRLPLWRRQAAADCGDCIPVVIYRRNNEPWRAQWPTAGTWGDWPLDAFFELSHYLAMHAALEREAAPSDRETGA